LRVRVTEKAKLIINILMGNLVNHRLPISIFDNFIVLIRQIAMMEAMNEQLQNFEWKGA